MTFIVSCYRSRGSTGPSKVRDRPGQWCHQGPSSVCLSALAPSGSWSSAAGLHADGAGTEGGKGTCTHTSEHWLSPIRSPPLQPWIAGSDGPHPDSRAHVRKGCALWQNQGIILEKKVRRGNGATWATNSIPYTECSGTQRAHHAEGMQLSLSAYRNKKEVTVAWGLGEREGWTAKGARGLLG